MKVKLFFLTILWSAQLAYANEEPSTTVSLLGVTALLCKEGLPKATVFLKQIEDSKVILASAVCVPKNIKNKKYPIRIRCQGSKCLVDEYQEKTLEEFERQIQQVIKENEGIST